MAKSSTKVTEGKVSDLVFDDKNFNKGTEYGKALIDKSVERFGAGRSVVVDKNMRLMAGNKFTEAFGEHGGEDIVIVETTGDKLVVVKRTDMDLDTKEGRDYAMADNATAKADLAWDNDVIGEVQQELGIEPEEWGVYVGTGEDVDIDGLFKEAGAAKDKDLTITITLPKQYEDNLEDIKASLAVTLEDFPGCKVK